MGLPDFQICDNDISTDILESYSTEPVLAIDTETMGLLPQRDRLCTVQLCDSSEHIVVVRLERGTSSAPNLKMLMEAESVEKIFHFARFDVTALKYHLGIQTQPLFCTKIASKLARTYTDRHGLKDLVKELLGAELDKTSQSSDWGAVYELTEAQLQYAANDVRYLIPARDRLIRMLEREERWDVAQRCFEHIPTRVDLDILGYGNIFNHH
ncbi:ribonuclease H-like domain-containing protein [Synechococcus sp. PCC 7336]|uniref:ribonuclease H-like domain-containing protein n=1 Tax=Synechococcus sp. PCC 7336 TaxID=195250 RepID=UPI00034CC81D|nr:ribonuclease H-like domain-containing protein [Synechococcus sp. PCC 7336]